MKQSLTLASTVLMTLTITTMAFAMGGGNHGGANSPVIPISATVLDVLELQTAIYKGDISNNDVVSAMSFGNLVANGNTSLQAENEFNVVLFANSSSRKYQITQTATKMKAGNEELPDGACLVTPFDINGTLPGGSSLANTSSFAQNDHIIYQSENRGSAQTLGAKYTIGDASAGELIPIDQPSGNYQTDVVFSLVLV